MGGVYIRKIITKYMKLQIIAARFAEAAVEHLHEYRFEEDC